MKVTPCERPAPQMPGKSTRITRTTSIYANLRYGNARQPGRCTVNTHIMSILCNATQFKVQCRMADPDGTRVPKAMPSIVRRRGGSLLGMGPDPPFLGEGL